MIGDKKQIPAGSFIFGSRTDDKIALADEKDQTTVNLPAFFIGAHLVTNMHYRGFLNSVGITERLIKLDDKNKCRIYKEDNTYCYEEGYGNHPVTFVSYYGAEMYAKHINSRLPTQEEWEKAARGFDGAIYPWGDEFKEGVSNCNEVYGTTTPVDLFKPNQFGCYDMSGNVSEWTSSAGRTGRRIVRGGSWLDEPDECRCAHREPVPENVFSSLIGFRCVD